MASYRKLPGTELLGTSGPDVMTDRNVVSVVVPTHNRRRYLEECLESVFCQSYGRWEIIVVDDASEDGTAAWLEAVQSDRLRFVRLDKNSGSTVTRNAGLREAKGEFCLFLDDDDLLPREALAAHAYALREHTDAIGTVGSLTRFDVSGELGGLRAAVDRTVHRDIWRDVVFWWGFLVGASVFRTEVLREAGGFDEKLFFFGDETDLWLRLGHRGPVVLLPDEVIRVRYHGQPRPKGLLRHPDRDHPAPHRQLARREPRHRRGDPRTTGGALRRPASLHTGRGTNRSHHAAARRRRTLSIPGRLPALRPRDLARHRATSAAMSTLTASGCRARQAHLWESLVEGVDVVVLSDPAHINYLSGFYPSPFAFGTTGGSGLLVMHRERGTALVTDNLLAQYAVEGAVDEVVAPVWYDCSTEAPLRRELVVRHAVAWLGSVDSEVAIEPSSIPVALRAALEPARTVNLEPSLLALRRTKYDDELALMRRAMGAGTAALDTARRELRPGQTELDLFDLLYRTALQTAGEPILMYGDFLTGDRCVQIGGPPHRSPNRARR